MLWTSWQAASPCIGHPDQLDRVAVVPVTKLPNDQPCDRFPFTLLLLWLLIALSIDVAQFVF